METETLAMASEIDFSMLALFARATFAVKIVMILLIASSFWSWAIIIQKTITYRRSRAQADAFDASFWSGEPLDELFDQIGPDPHGGSERIFAAGMMDWRRSGDRQRDRGAEWWLAVSGDGRFDRAFCRPVRHGLGHHACV